MDNQVVVTDYRQMDKILKEERQYLLNLCKTIKKSGCNVILLQKSILRDAVNDLSLHFLAKLKIMVVKDVERDEIDFLSRSLGCKPIADIEAFTEDKLGQAELVDEVEKSGAKVVRITGVKNPSGRTQSVLLTGANHTVLDESERSLHDALCVVRCLVQKRALIAGGGAPEVHVSRLLAAHAQTLKGMEAYCFAAYAEALEVIPTTLAENAGLNPIAIVTELRNRHAKGDRSAGINVRKGLISNIVSLVLHSHFSAMTADHEHDLTARRERVAAAPWYVLWIGEVKNIYADRSHAVSTSAVELATETVALMVSGQYNFLAA